MSDLSVLSDLSVNSTASRSAGAIDFRPQLPEKQLKIVDGLQKRQVLKVFGGYL